MAAKLLEVWRGDAESRCAAAMSGRAEARGARARAGRQAGWPRGLRAAKMEDGGAEPRKHSSPPLPHPPFPARRGGEGGGERSASERARGRRKRPPCPPRPPSSLPRAGRGQAGPGARRAKMENRLLLLLLLPPSAEPSRGCRQDGGLGHCVRGVCVRASRAGPLGWASEGNGVGARAALGGSAGPRRENGGAAAGAPGSNVGGGRGQGTRTLDSARHGFLPPAPCCPAAEFFLPARCRSAQGSA